MTPVAVLALTLSTPLNPDAQEKDAKSPRVVRVENGGLLFTDNAAGVSGVDGYCSLAIGRQDFLALRRRLFCFTPRRLTRLRYGDDDHG
jgi:hypothetical protein